MAIFLPFMLVIVGVFWYLIFRLSRSEIYKHSKSIPGLPLVRLIQNAYIIRGQIDADFGKIQKFITDETRKQGGILKIWFGPYLYIAITNLNYIQLVLSQALDRDVAFKYLEPWIGRGLISGNTPIWRKHRRFLAPAFHQKHMDSFVDMFAEKSAIMTKVLEKEAGQGEFNIETYVRLRAFDVIHKAIFGVELNSQNGQHSEYINAFILQNEIVSARFTQLWLRSDLLFNLSSYGKKNRENLRVVKKFTAELFEKAKLQIEEKLKKENDDEYEDQFEFKTFLESMLRMPQDERLSDEKILNEIDSLIGAGSDTSVNESCFILLILGSLPEIQEKVVDELKQIFGDSKRLPDKYDIPKMVYLDCVIKETLRLFPVVPFLVRKLNREIKLDKYTLPAGSNCVVTISSLHRDKSSWGENAEEFYPERFLPENIVERHPYSYIPFSAGVKSCLGMHYAMREMKITVSTILRSYKVSSSIDYKNLPLRLEFLMSPVGGYFISIEKRTN